MLKSKIHRATVTDANLDYEGSITLDPVLMKEANLIEFEKVHVLDVTNGNRLETYVIKGQENSGEVCINGAAAHLINVNDLVIIASYCSLNDEELIDFKPTIILVNEKNQVKEKSHQYQTVTV
jgi:aspartate 1-decarboxylase|tara:strand:- start:195 stop:563 length:369 start_codon:yes stop_codon:yes gene_type:complete